MSDRRTGHDRQTQGNGEDSSHQPCVWAEAAALLRSDAGHSLSANVGAIKAGHRAKLAENYCLTGTFASNSHPVLSGNPDNSNNG